MKRKNVPFTLFALFAFSLPIHSQRYTIEELKQGFYDQYVEKQGNKDENQFDLLEEVDKRTVLSETSLDYICDSILIRHAGGISLPPSKYVYMTDDEVGEQTTKLYWMGTLTDSHSKECEKLREKLKKKYGYVPLRGDTVLIPAKWLSSEQFDCIVNPFRYGNTWVSYRCRRAKISEGKFICAPDELPFVSFRKPYNEMEEIVNQISWVRLDRKLPSIRVGGDMGLEARALLCKKGLTLFARDINRLIDKRLIPEEMKKEYSIMLYLDEDTLKAHVHPLLPQELTDEDRLLLSLLSTAVEQQPAGTFEGYYSDRGFFPAIYLKANLSKGHWSFEDYRFVDVYEAMKKPKR